MNIMGDIAYGLIVIALASIVIALFIVYRQSKASSTRVDKKESLNKSDLKDR